MINDSSVLSGDMFVILYTDRKITSVNVSKVKDGAQRAGDDGPPVFRTVTIPVLGCYGAK